MDTTCTVLDTHTLTGAPRAFTRGRQITTVTTVITTRGRLNMSQAKMLTPTLLLLLNLLLLNLQRSLSPTMSLHLPITLLVGMDTTSTVPATHTSTGALRVFTRGMPLATVTSTWTVMTAMDTTARTQSMESRSKATMPMSTRTEKDTEALSGHANEHENVSVVLILFQQKY